MSSKILNGLNAEQLQAVTHKEGPLLIIAGAGTGKTTVITRKIAWIIEQGLCRSDEILALTFTDKAASSMQEKVDLLVPYGCLDIWISTFHAFGDRLLRENALDLGLNPDFKVLTRPEAAVFLREHLFEFDLDYYRPLSDPTRFIDALLEVFSRLKDEDISVSDYQEFSQRKTSEVEKLLNLGGLKKTPDSLADEALREEAQKAKEVAYCYAKFQELLIKEGKIDFGNQFYLALDLLRRHPSILKRYRKQFKYILVDEFQDTNFTQFQLVKLLAGQNGNICVCGDDDQAIYRWRGAAYSNILNFIKDYPGSAQIALIQNYRSTQALLDSAYRLIQHNNPERFEVKSNINKRLVSQSKDRGNIPEYLYFDALSTESDNAAKIIRQKVDSGKYSYGDFAILVRANNDADPFLRSLNMLNIPWRFSGNQGLYSREEVRLCIFFLRLMSNIQDSLSLYYLATGEIYSLTPVALSPAMHFSKRHNQPLFFVLKNLDNNLEVNQFVDNQVQEKIKVLIADVEKFLEASRDMTSGCLLYQFLTQTGFIKRLVQSPSVKNEEKLLNVAKFFDLVRNFEVIAKEDRVIYFTNYLNFLMEAGDDPATAEADMDADAVNVLTVHKAKGLEFRVVFMVGLVTGRFPWPRRKSAIELPDELIKDILPGGDFHIQEERRLFYVGMTRAKEELYLTSSSDYGGSRLRKISQFIPEALEVNPEGLKALIKKSSGLEKISRYAGQVSDSLNESVKRKLGQEDILNLSYYQIDDYQTCPLKYKYVHILRVPIMEHHTVFYGKALHDAVQKYYLHKMRGASLGVEGLVNAFLEAFRQEGFLDLQHLNKRQEAGIYALRRFFQREEALIQMPSYIEKEFSIIVGNNRISGRWDMLIMDEKESRVVDFKSSQVVRQKDADRKAKESLQLTIYAMAFEHYFKKLPDWTELHFLDSGLIGRAKKTAEDIEKAREVITQASCGIRQEDFAARPGYLSCGYCAYNSICPAKEVGANETA